MPKKPTSPGVQAYYATLHHVFELESSKLTGVLPHYGERGANDELRVRAFLQRVLPRKFSVGTGFIVCSEPGVPPSRQTDIVIFDEVQNSPLHRELAADVYPVEMVYGTVEVKGVLTRKDLQGIADATAMIRALAPHGYKAVHAVRRVPLPEGGEGLVTHVLAQPTRLPPPRSFVFAFSQKGFKSPDQLKKALETTRRSSHIHGLVVLDKNWFFVQQPYSRPRHFEYATDNALMLLVKQMINSMSSLPIAPMSVDRYLTPLPALSDQEEA
jgi:hypothetical protein